MSNKYAPIESVKPVAISVIVPIDNTEKYLEGNLQSVQQQSFDNWELILVDNGSTDSSLRIVQSFAQSDERISVIPFKKKQNSKEEAVEIPANIAIQNAKGKYITFLDSCDLYYPDFWKSSTPIQN